MRGQLLSNEAANKMFAEAMKAVFNKRIKLVGKYQRHCKESIIDVYDVLQAFEVHNPAIAHAVKKLLAPGKRGVKDVIQDLEESISAIHRAIELEKNK